MHVPAIVRNPADLDRSWEGRFLVDTGAIDCLVPRQHLEAIGQPVQSALCWREADGSEIRLDVTIAGVEFMGGITGTDVVMGEAAAEPLLGVTALEALGIEIDPRNERLTKMPSTRLRGFRSTP